MPEHRCGVVRGQGRVLRARLLCHVLCGRVLEADLAIMT